MSSKYNRREALVNYLALALTTLGLLLLLLKILSDAYARLHGGSVFGAPHLDSGADGYRLFVYAGVIFAGGLIYSTDRLGKVLGAIIAAVVLWQLGLWFSAYPRFNVTDFWQVLDLLIMGLFFLTFSGLVLYLPYSLVKRPKAISDYPPARQGTLG
jgi:hypothetical protein